jgi:hypothetical protein
MVLVALGKELGSLTTLSRPGPRKRASWRFSFRQHKCRIADDGSTENRSPAPVGGTVSLLPSIEEKLQAARFINRFADGASPTVRPAPRTRRQRIRPPGQARVELLTKARQLPACTGRTGLARGQELLGSAREQLQQQPVQPVDRLCPGAAEFVALVGEHADYDQVRVDLDTDQVPGAQKHTAGAVPDLAHLS